MLNMRAMAVLMTALSLTACDDFVGPWGLSGTYDLQSANGDPVPSVVYSRGGTNPLVVTLTGGLLRLRDDDTFTLDIDYAEDDGAAHTHYTQGIAPRWRTCPPFPTAPGRCCGTGASARCWRWAS